jgi:hypothetical protein
MPTVLQWRKYPFFFKPAFHIKRKEEQITGNMYWQGDMLLTTVFGRRIGYLLSRGVCIALHVVNADGKE